MNRNLKLFMASSLPFDMYFVSNSVATGSEFPVPGIAIPGPGRVRVYP